MSTDNTPTNSIKEKLRELLEYEVGLKRTDNWDRAINRIFNIFGDDEEWFNRGQIVLREDATQYIPVEPTNSIDSELEEILTKLENEVSRDTALRVSQHRSGRSPKSSHREALQSINNLYISRQKVEGALEIRDRSYTLDNPNWERNRGRNDLRAELRAKLLPPTKGGNDG